MDDTSKHAKFQVDGFSTFGDMTSQKFPFQNGMSHRDSIFISWIQAKLDKNHFLCLKTSFLNNFIPPLHFHSFEAKQETSYAQFVFKMSHFKNNCSNPLVNRISLKFCQNVCNR